MRALVIGGNRFFGKRLVANLLEARADVTLLNRGQLQDPFGDHVERIIADRRELSRNSAGLKDEKWDVVFDQACYEASEARSACEIFSDRVSHYIFTSSESVYECAADITEEVFDPHAHTFETDADRNQNYSEAKRQCEAEFFQSGAFPVTALRFPFVVGSDDYTGRLKFHIDRISNDKPLYFPNLDAKISLISSADAAAALHFVARRGTASGPLNCAGRKPLALRELVALIEKLSHKSAKILKDLDEGAHSPYGVTADWWMRVTKMQDLGFAASDWENWLAPLVHSELKVAKN